MTCAAIEETEATEAAEATEATEATEAAEAAEATEAAEETEATDAAEETEATEAAEETEAAEATEATGHSFIQFNSQRAEAAASGGGFLHEPPRDADICDHHHKSAGGQGRKGASSIPRSMMDTRWACVAASFAFCNVSTGSAVLHRQHGTGATAVPPGAWSRALR